MSLAIALPLLELTAIAATPRFGAMVPFIAANGAPSSGPLLRDVDGYERAANGIIGAIRGQEEVHVGGWVLREQPHGFSGIHVSPHGSRVTEVKADLDGHQIRVNESAIRRGKLVEVSQALVLQDKLVKNSVTILFSPFPFQDPFFPQGLQNHRGFFGLIEVLENIAKDFSAVNFSKPLKVQIDFFVSGERRTQVITIPLDELFLQYAIEFLDQTGRPKDVVYLNFPPGPYGHAVFSSRPMRTLTVKIQVPDRYDFIKATGLRKDPYEGIEQTHFSIFFAVGGAEYTSQEPAFVPRSPYRAFVAGGADLFGTKERIVARPGSWHLPTVFATYRLAFGRLQGRP